MWTLPPPPTRMATFPSAPSGTVIMFAAFRPPPKLTTATVDALSLHDSLPIYPDPDGDTAVRFNTTDVTPDDGTPPLPATCKVTVAPAATGPVVPPAPVRVSISRTGPAGKKAEPAEAA